MFHSEYHPYSYGIVASPKDAENGIEVVPIEVLPTTDTIIDITPKTYAIKGVDRFGNTYESETEYSDTIPARWIAMDYNRLTAPDVQPGETVMLYQFSDLQEFFWVTMKDKSHLRTLEHVVYAFSAKPVADGEPLSVENAYVLMVSPMEGYVRFSTSRANGEPVTYVLEINTKDGKFGFVDSKANQLYVDSLASLIELINEKESKLRLDQDSIEMSAPKDINIKAGGDLYFEAGGNISGKAGGDFSSKAGGSLTNDAGADLKNKAGAALENKAGADMKNDAGGGISSKAGGDHIIDGAMILIG